MAQWGVRKRIAYISPRGENKPQISSSIAEGEALKDEVKAAVKVEPLVLPEFKRKRRSCGQLKDVVISSSIAEGEALVDYAAVKVEPLLLPEVKRKRHSRGQLKEVKAELHGKESSSFSSIHSKNTQKKLKSTIERWSVERYQRAEQSMLEVMKAEDATCGNPISRPALRTAARKRIGDTGLLDHLLKHIDGKVTPGGTERFRRCFSPNGVMEYWLENADLVKIRREAGWQDPYGIAPSRWMSCCDSSQDPVSAGELMLLKAEMVKLKRDMQELVSKNREQDHAEVIHKELVKWKATVDENLKEITNSVEGMKGMHEELVAWKPKVEQQLMEIKNSLSSIQASKQETAFCPPASERWEDWLESSNPDNIQEDEFTPWFESTDMGNVALEVAMQNPYAAPPPELKTCGLSEDPVCARELELLKEEMTKIKRDVLELVPKKQEVDQANVTPESSTTANSKSDLDYSLLPFQDMIMELFKWKEKMQHQVEEISTSVSGMQASRQIDFLLPFDC